MNRVLSLVAVCACVGAWADEAPIGVFDSGLGGLTVLERLLDVDQVNNATGLYGPDGVPDLARERFVYLGDQANMPYGDYAAEGKSDYLRELILKVKRRDDHVLQFRFDFFACHFRIVYQTPRRTATTYQRERRDAVRGRRRPTFRNTSSPKRSRVNGTGFVVTAQEPVFRPYLNARVNCPSAVRHSDGRLGSATERNASETSGFAAVESRPVSRKRR